MNNLLSRKAAALVTLLVAVSSFCVAQLDPTRIYWIKVTGGETGDFAISATEVTFAQFDAFCDATGYEKPEDVVGRGFQPVVNITKEDALAYCAWLSKQTGAVVRLPNPTEWSFAATGGTNDATFTFCGSGNPQEVAWFEENSDEDEFSEDTDLPEPRVHLVATKQPNMLGIYDMSGNVWEFCDSVSYAMGGAFNSIGQDCFPYSSSGELDPDYRAGNLGFRVLMKK